MNDDRLKAALETIISYQKLEVALLAENARLKTALAGRTYFHSDAEVEKERDNLAARVGELTDALNYLYNDRTATGVKINELCSQTAEDKAINALRYSPAPSAADRLRDEAWREAEAALTSMKIDTKTCGRDADKAVKWNCKWDSAAEILRAARPSAFEVKP